MVVMASSGLFVLAPDDDVVQRQGVSKDVMRVQEGIPEHAEARDDGFNANALGVDRFEAPCSQPEASPVTDAPSGPAAEVDTTGSPGSLGVGVDPPDRTDLAAITVDVDHA